MSFAEIEASAPVKPTPLSAPRDLLECPSCEQRFSADQDHRHSPVSLILCDHTICKSCASLASFKTTDRSVACPVCNQVSPRYVPNIAAVPIIAALNVHKDITLVYTESKRTEMSEPLQDAVPPDMLKCSICFERFDDGRRRPMITECCGNTFCLSCLHQHRKPERCAGLEKPMPGFSVKHGPGEKCDYWHPIVCFYCKEPQTREEFHIKKDRLPMNTNRAVLEIITFNSARQPPPQQQQQSRKRRVDDNSSDSSKSQKDNRNSEEIEGRKFALQTKLEEVANKHLTPEEAKFFPAHWKAALPYVDYSDPYAQALLRQGIEIAFSNKEWYSAPESQEGLTEAQWLNFDKNYLLLMGTHAGWYGHFVRVRNPTDPYQVTFKNPARNLIAKPEEKAEQKTVATAELNRVKPSVSGRLRRPTSTHCDLEYHVTNAHDFQVILDSLEEIGIKNPRITAILPEGDILISVA